MVSGLNVCLFSIWCENCRFPRNKRTAFPCTSPNNMIASLFDVRISAAKHCLCHIKKKGLANLFAAFVF